MHSGYKVHMYGDWNLMLYNYDWIKTSNELSRLQLRQFSFGELKWILIGKITCMRNANIKVHVVKTKILPSSSSDLSVNGQNAEAKWKVNKAKTDKWRNSILLF